MAASSHLDFFSVWSTTLTLFSSFSIKDTKAAGDGDGGEVEEEEEEEEKDKSDEKDPQRRGTATPEEAPLVRSVKERALGTTAGEAAAFSLRRTPLL